MKHLKSDFLNLDLYLNPELKKSISIIPHKFVDNFGQTLSSYHEETATVANAIKIQNTNIGQLFLAPDSSTAIVSILEASIQSAYQNSEKLISLLSTNLLANDYEEILKISELDFYSFEEQLKHLLRILRTHVCVERASIFGIYDGFTLEGMAGIGGHDQSNWKLSLSSLAGEAASSRKIFHTENPQKEPQFMPKDGMEVPRNIVCNPLLHGNTLVGVMNLSNRIGGSFTSLDFEIIEKFSHLASHLLQKHYFKRRMQSFEKTSDHLGKYLSSKVVKNVKSLKQLELGGVEKKVVCLFSDIRGYTSITEDIPAPTLVKLLNFHFDHMTAIIEKYEGTVDKIVGDLIMAVWNIPHDQPEPELLAMKAALEMQKEMIRKVIPEWTKHEIEKVGMGVGVNAGTALAGNLGSSRFMNYTVIGDTINTAQRLEAKASAGEVWMAESMFEFVSGKIEKPIRKESSIRLKGKDKIINAYVYKPLSY